jgi:hypothetical protein
VQVGVLRAYHSGVKGRQAYVYRIRKVTSDSQTTADSSAPIAPACTTAKNSSHSHTFTGLESGAQYELQIAVRSAAGVGGFGAYVYRRPQ